jgi:NADH-quinone oxidoreductase subunit E
MNASNTTVEVDRLLNGFSPEKSNIIPILQAVQGRLGYLPEDAIKRISEYTKTPEAEIMGVASFYTQFRFTPVGKHMVTVCRGTACHVLGSKKLVDELEDLLGIHPGGTTSDMNFSLQTVACFGSCALAPLVVVDGKVYGRVTSQKAKELLDSIRNGGRGPSESEEPMQNKAEIGAAPTPPASAKKPAKPKSKPASKKIKASKTAKSSKIVKTAKKTVSSKSTGRRPKK